MVRLCRFAPLLMLMIAGCGGGAEDPFQRVRVHGTATVAGAPIAHGILRLEGDKKDDLAANLILTITDGKFDSEAEGFEGITAGQCNVELHQYEDAEGEKPLGTWLGIITVPDDGSEVKVEVPEGGIEKLRVS